MRQANPFGTEDSDQEIERRMGLRFFRARFCRMAAAGDKESAGFQDRGSIQEKIAMTFIVIVLGAAPQGPGQGKQIIKVSQSMSHDQEMSAREIGFRRPGDDQRLW
jgi:hypothetical protein